MIQLPEYYYRDPGKKDKQWANTVITYLRTHLQFVVGQEKALKGMQTILGDYDMEFAKKMFRDWQESGVCFAPTAVLEKLRNILISEIEDAGIHVEVKSVDPVATNEKKKDRELLAQRRSIEALFNTLRSEIKMAPYSLKNEKDESGRPIFKGNIEDFEGMGLDPNSAEDLDYFFDIHHRLRHEIYAQEPINYFMKMNEMDKNLALWVDDILAKKAIACQVYVDKTTGQIKQRYVPPELIKSFSNNRRDLKDAPAIAVEQKVTVSELLGMMGDDFNPETDWQYILQAVNSTWNRAYTGIVLNNSLYWGYGQGLNICNYYDLLQLKISVGYIEWMSFNDTVIKYTGKDFIGNPRVRYKRPTDMPEGKQAKNRPDGYQRKTHTDPCIYKSWYLILSTAEQWLFGFGKLPYQHIEGAEDEYARYSIRCVMEVGKTVAEIAWPYIVIIEKAFKKFEWMINAAKPPGTDYNYESLVAVATKMFDGMKTAAAVNELMKMFAGTSNTIHSNENIDGNVIGGSGQVHTPLANGLSAAAVQFQEIMNWAKNEINNLLGISPLRQAYQPGERDTYKLQQAANASSDKATGYVPRMINTLLENVAISTLNFVQSGVKYKGVNDSLYKYLLTALGDKVVEDIESVGDVAYHRYGIFVHAYDSYAERQEMKLIIQQAFVNKEITVEQMLLINSIKNPKRAAMTLAYEKRRNERKQQEAAQKQHEYLMMQQQQQQQGQLQIKQMEIQGEIEKENVKGQWDYKVKELEIQGQLAGQDKKSMAQLEQSDKRTANRIEEKAAAANIDSQTALPS